MKTRVRYVNAIIGGGLSWAVDALKPGAKTWLVYGRFLTRELARQFAKTLKRNFAEKESAKRSKKQQSWIKRSVAWLNDSRYHADICYWIKQGCKRKPIICTSCGRALYVFPGLAKYQPCPHCENVLVVGEY